jgi:hypothetical protein
MSNKLPPNMKVFGPVDPPQHDWKTDPRVVGDITDPVRPVKQELVTIGELCEAMNVLNRMADQFPVLLVRIAKQEKFYRVLTNKNCR